MLSLKQTRKSLGREREREKKKDTRVEIIARDKRRAAVT